MIAPFALGSHNYINFLMPILEHMNGTYAPIDHKFAQIGLVGINQATNCPELAKDFVSFLFDEEMQKLDLDDGFPVNEKVLDSWVKPSEVLGSSYYLTPGNSMQWFKYDQVTSEDMQKLVNMVKTLDQPIFRGIEDRYMIIDDTIDYLNGTKTIEQVVDEAAKRYSLQLAE